MVAEHLQELSVPEISIFEKEHFVSPHVFVGDEVASWLNEAGFSDIDDEIALKEVYFTFNLKLNRPRCDMDSVIEKLPEGWKDMTDTLPRDLKTKLTGILRLIDYKSGDMDKNCGIHTVGKLREVFNEDHKSKHRLGELRSNTGLKHEQLNFIRAVIHKSSAGNVGN